MKKSIGIDIKPPEKECKDINCAWHGSLAIRGRVFNGVVKSAKSHNTVIVEWGYHKFVRKYERYARRKSRVTAYNPPCIHAREGNIVTIAECRPLSKTKKFVVVGKEEKRILDIRGEEQVILKKEKSPSSQEQKASKEKQTAYGNRMKPSGSKNKDATQKEAKETQKRINNGLMRGKSTQPLKEDE